MRGLKHQRIQPTYAWAYALEAVYTNHEFNRIRAAGMTLYVDMQSEWLKSVPSEIVEKAKAWREKDNPFVNPAGGGWAESVGT